MHTDSEILREGNEENEGETRYELGTNSAIQNRQLDQIRFGACDGHGSMQACVVHLLHAAVGQEDVAADAMHFCGPIAGVRFRELEHGIFHARTIRDIVVA